MSYGGVLKQPVIVLAIANRQNLDPRQQQALDLEDATEGMEPPVCAVQRDDGHYCVREAGHSGRHQYRPINGVMTSGDFRRLTSEIVAASWDR